MWPLISPASGAPVSASRALISECPVCIITGLPPARGDLVEQDLARLDIGEDRRAGVAAQHVARQHQQQLIAPQNAPARIDDADAVAVAVEPDAEIAAFGGDRLLQLHQILRDRRVGVMRRKPCRRSSR